jgi:oligopeptide transport system substrate-binding protein
MQPGKRLAIPAPAVFICFLAMLLSACGGGATTPTPSTGPVKAAANKQIVISPISGTSDIKTFDPALATDIRSISSIDMIFTGLVSLNDKLQVQDQLAQSHSVSADGLTYTFKLRPNLKFSDGAPLTSHDVVYSIDRALQPATKSASALFYMGLIKDADKLNSGKIPTIINDSLLTPDNQTVVIKIAQKAAYFLNALTYPCAYVVEKSFMEKYGTGFADHLTDGAGSTGPFVLSKFEHGTLLEFSPNKNYYGPIPQVKVEQPFYSQDDAVYKDYQVNQVQMTKGVPTAQMASAKALPDNQFHAVPQQWTYYYGMNFLTKPFDNLKIRQAFALAINKDVIAQTVYKDAVIPTNHIVPQGIPGYDSALTAPSGVKGTSGDKALAKQLLAEGMKEAGYSSIAALPPITFTVSTSGDTDARNEAVAVQQMWQTVLGVNVKIQDVSVNKLFELLDANPGNPKGLQMWKVDWIGDYPDPQDWMTLQFAKGASNNTMNYGQNPGPYAAQQQQIQQLLTQADGEGDLTKRMQMYNQAEQALVNDVVWIPMYQEISTFVRQPCVVGLVDNSQDLTPPNDWGSVYISTATPCALPAKYQ